MAKREDNKTGERTERKLYGAAAAAHAGVLYGAAKKSAEARAARLAAEGKALDRKPGDRGREKAEAAGRPEPVREKTTGRAADGASGGEVPAGSGRGGRYDKTGEAKPERKLYGAAAAAHAGVLYGAAKRSAEARAARLAASGKQTGRNLNGKAAAGTGPSASSKATVRGNVAGRGEQTTPHRERQPLAAGVRNPSDGKGKGSGDKPEKKLYGAAAAAHAGVLYGAAKKSAEARAARLAAEAENAAAGGSRAKSREKKTGTERKLYGAAAAAHAGVLFGAAKKSAEARAARLAAMGIDPMTAPPAKRKKEDVQPKKSASRKEAVKQTDRSRRSLSWEEEELLLSGVDGEEIIHEGREVDEALQQQFQKKLQELLVIAKKKKNVLEYNEIKGYLVDLGLDEEHLEWVLEKMESEGVDVLKTDEDLDELPEDDEIIIEEEEEVDMDNIDLSVPDSVAIEDPVRMYLKEIGKVPLLSAEEEISLAKLMEAGLAADKRLRDDRTKMTPEGRKNVQDRIREYEKQLRILDKEKLVGEDEDALEQAALELEEKKTRLHDLIENSKKMLDQDKLKKKLTPKERETLKDPIALGEDAKNRLAEANLRLVVSIAKRYVGRGMLFLDLIQEGNLGLIKAVEKFDFRKGFKFSTYATWWIRQAITRAIADQARTIRIPVHMVETINKLIRISRQLLQELGREPTPDEIAEKMNMPVDRVREILKISQEPVSLETPIGEEEDSHLGDFIQDDHVPVPADAAAFTLLKEQLVEVLGTLTEREQKVLRLRFGLDDGRARTLEEVGREFNVTRERIRQIEAKALRKLRHPSRSRKLKDYLD